MKYTLIILLCFLSIKTLAQSGFYIQPFAGPGLANVNHVYYTRHTGSDDYAVNFDAGALAGYRQGKWVFTTGLEFLCTGSKAPVALTDALGNTIGTYWLHYRFGHIVLPLETGRVLRIGKKTTLTPSIGVGLSYNTSASEKFDLNQKVYYVHSGVSNSYTGGKGCYAMAQAELAWPVTSQLAITCSPTFTYMLSQMIFPQVSPDVIWDHDYSLLLNIGVKWKFAKNEKGASKNTVKADK